MKEENTYFVLFSDILSRRATQWRLNLRIRTACSGLSGTTRKCSSSLATLARTSGTRESAGVSCDDVQASIVIGCLGPMFLYAISLDLLHILWQFFFGIRSVACLVPCNWRNPFGGMNCVVSYMYFGVFSETLQFNEYCSNIG